MPETGAPAGEAPAFTAVGQRLLRPRLDLRLLAGLGLGCGWACACGWFDVPVGAVACSPSTSGVGVGVGVSSPASWSPASWSPASVVSGVVVSGVGASPASCVGGVSSPASWSSRGRRGDPDRVGVVADVLAGRVPEGDRRDGRVEGHVDGPAVGLLGRAGLDAVTGDDLAGGDVGVGEGDGDRRRVSGGVDLARRQWPADLVGLGVRRPGHRTHGADAQEGCAEESWWSGGGGGADGAVHLVFSPKGPCRRGGAVLRWNAGAVAPT